MFKHNKLVRFYEQFCCAVWKECKHLYFFNSRANEEIAQVRNKAKSEIAALQASLRKEQMRIQSLERSLEQKVCQSAVSLFSLLPWTTSGGLVPVLEVVPLSVLVLVTAL